MGWHLAIPHIYTSFILAGNLKPVLKPVYLKIQSLMVGAKVKISENQSEFLEQEQDWEMGLIEAYQEDVDGEVEEETYQLGQVEENEGVCDKYMEEAREVSDYIAENMEFVEKTAEKFEAFRDDLIQTPEPAVPEKDMMNSDSISKYEQEEDDENEVVAEDVKEVKGGRWKWKTQTFNPVGNVVIKPYCS